MEQQRRKNFFENFAASKGFDPLVSQNWQNLENEFSSFPVCLVYINL